VLALLETFVAFLIAKLGLEHDLRGPSTQIEYSIGRSVLRRITSDSIEKIIRGDPRINALIFAIHDDHAILIGKRERVFGKDVVMHCIEDVIALAGAEKSKPSGGFDSDRRATAQRFRYHAHSFVKERVKTLCRRSWESYIRREPWLNHAEYLILKGWRGSAVVELVDVNARASRTGVNHEGILHKRESRRMWGCTVYSFEEVWVCFGRGRDGGLGWWRGSSSFVNVDFIL
jgi:hypothetical protein